MELSKIGSSWNLRGSKLELRELVELGLLEVDPHDNRKFTLKVGVSLTEARESEVKLALKEWLDKHWHPLFPTGYLNGKTYRVSGNTADCLTAIGAIVMRTKATFDEILTVTKAYLEKQRLEDWRYCQKNIRYVKTAMETDILEFRKNPGTISNFANSWDRNVSTNSEDTSKGWTTR